MRASAVLKNVHISPQKARLVADQIRGLPVSKAVDLLEFSPKKGAHFIRKVLVSAMANAEHNSGADIDELKVDTIYVDAGTTAKRFHARARGRANQIIKRTSHITVIVAN